MTAFRVYGYCMYLLLTIIVFINGYTTIQNSHHTLFFFYLININYFFWDTKIRNIFIDNYWLKQYVPLFLSSKKPVFLIGRYMIRNWERTMLVLGWRAREKLNTNIRGRLKMDVDIRNIFQTWLPLAPPITFNIILDNGYNFIIIRCHITYIVTNAQFNISPNVLYYSLSSSS